MTQITLTKVSKRFTSDASAAAVRDVDLTVRSGEFFTLLGPSGCGKTTTLRMVAGFAFPSDGTIAFDGDDVTKTPVHRRGTGMVFQNYALFPHLSVADNVGYGLRVRHVGSTERGRRIAEALGQVHLDGYGPRRIDEMSGGQQQRVALARALVIKPRVLLLDEPLSNLDAKLREETRREIRRIQTDAGTTALYVTHDQAEAMAMSDRIAVMESGTVHQVGTPREIYGSPRTAFVARFIGNSNVLDATVVAGSAAGLRIRVGGQGPELSVSLPDHVEVADGAVQIAVRPEHVRIEPAGTPGTMPATVLSAEFTGMATTLDLDMASHHVGAALIGGAPAPEVGERVGLRLDPEHLTVVAP